MKALLSLDEIHVMAISNEANVRADAAQLLGESFPQIRDPVKAWIDLHILAQDEDDNVRSKAAVALGHAFLFITDKQAAWNDLHKLAHDNDTKVRWMAILALDHAFPFITDKLEAWNDLYILAQVEDSFGRKRAAYALGRAYSIITDKQTAWNDLHSLANNEAYSVRESSAIALGHAFSFIANKQTAWNDLHKLAHDENRKVRSSVAIALDHAFPFITDKQEAWNDLYTLAMDNDCFVRWMAADVLSCAFLYIPDKIAAWDDLHTLAREEDKFVRSSAAYALGRASIFKATEAENNDEFKANIEEAIEFFSKASKESEYINPADFCLPFYRSLHSLLFTTESEKSEVNRYLIEARNAVEESASKEKLLEAVENLSNALKEARSYTPDDIVKRRHDLKDYAKYCFQAADCINEVKDKAPIATKIIDIIMVEKGIPILGDKIKVLLKKLEEAAESFSRASKDTPLEGLARGALEQTKTLEYVKTRDEANRALRILLTNIRGQCSLLPADIREAECKQLTKAETGSPLEQAIAISSAVGAFAAYAQDMKENAWKAQKFIDDLISQTKARLDEIDFHLLRLSLISSNVAINSSEMVAILKELKEQLEEIAVLGPRLEILQSSSDKLDLSIQKRLEEKDQDIIKIAESLDKILKKMPENRDKKYLSQKLEELKEDLKEPMFWSMANRAGAIASIVSLILVML